MTLKSMPSSSYFRGRVQICELPPAGIGGLWTENYAITLRLLLGGGIIQAARGYGTEGQERFLIINVMWTCCGGSNSLFRVFDKVEFRLVF